MSKYKATDTIITLGKISYILLFAGALLTLFAWISSGYPGGLIVTGALLLLGFTNMFSVELLSIFRDIADNTSKTNELLGKK